MRQCLDTSPLQKAEAMVAKLQEEHSAFLSFLGISEDLLSEAQKAISGQGGDDDEAGNLLSTAAEALLEGITSSVSLAQRLSRKLQRAGTIVAGAVHGRSDDGEEGGEEGTRMNGGEEEEVEGGAIEKLSWLSQLLEELQPFCTTLVEQAQQAVSISCLFISRSTLVSP